MPNYEFMCSACEHKFEEIVPYMKSHNMKCPQCKGAVKKLISRPGKPITDKGFCMTGVYDKRFGSKIEGRKDWAKKLKAKGLAEMSMQDVKDM